HVAQLVVEVGDDVLDEVLAAAEVPVERGRGHAHLAGDRPQRQTVGAVVDQHTTGRLLDLADRVGAHPVASTDRPVWPAGTLVVPQLSHNAHAPPPRVGLTQVTGVCRVSGVS